MHWAQLLGHIPALLIHLVLKLFSVSGDNTTGRKIPIQLKCCPSSQFWSSAQLNTITNSIFIIHLAILFVLVGFFKHRLL